MSCPVWETCRRPNTLQSCECPPPLSEQDAAGPVCPQQRGFLSAMPLGWVLAEKWVLWVDLSNLLGLWLCLGCKTLPRIVEHCLWLGVLSLLT